MEVTIKKSVGRTIGSLMIGQLFLYKGSLFVVVGGDPDSSYKDARHVLLLWAGPKTATLNFPVRLSMQGEAWMSRDSEVEVVKSLVVEVV
jgi:hypothetical protein